MAVGMDVAAAGGAGDYRQVLVLLSGSIIEQCPVEHIYQALHSYCDDIRFFREYFRCFQPARLRLVTHIISVMDYC